jgi:hypothetical protein
MGQYLRAFNLKQVLNGIISQLSFINVKNDPGFVASRIFLGVDSLFTIHQSPMNSKKLVRDIGEQSIGYNLD